MPSEDQETAPSGEIREGRYRSNLHAELFHPPYVPHDHLNHSAGTRPFRAPSQIAAAAGSTTHWGLEEASTISWR